MIEETMQEQQIQVPEKLVIPLFEMVVYPESRTKFAVDETTGSLLLEAMESGESTQAIALTVKSGTRACELNSESLYRIGTLLRLSHLQPADDGYVVMADVVQRVAATGITEKNGRYYATFRILPDEKDIDDDLRGRILTDIKLTIHETSSRFTGSEQFTKPIDEMDRVDQVMGFVMPFLPVSVAEKQNLLEITSLRQRYITFLELLTRARDTIAIRMEMAKKVSDRVGKSNREAMLREQLKVIQEELGEETGEESDSGYREKITQSAMPDDVKKKALAEVRKLETGGPHNHEGTVIRNWLDLLVDLPWSPTEPQGIDITQARKVLEEHHNGLEKVKERIIQHLAVMKLKKEKQGSILLFSGPPGTGKTSLGKSIAQALGRKYVRVSLGGVRDEAEIRGHRRTYVGALPGRIIQGIRKAGVKNPVFVLDEIDKLASSYSGDPASALLEVLDPEQNNTFSDHYLEVPFDLSDVLFIATANNLATIPAPLLDRMELITISGYTRNEKFAIAKDHLIPAVLAEHGLDTETLRFEDEALRTIIDKYTREAGVRWLRKQLAKAARHVSEKIVDGTAEKPFVVTSKNLGAILGKEMIRKDVARKEAVPGVVTGLAWTPVGGEILFIEGTFMPGKGSLTLTGQLGDVMKESAAISLSLIRSRLGGQPGRVDFLTSDIHIHVPSGATPKDGPSAGVTLFTALASLMTGKTAAPDLAMTGEITLSGAVLPVGGIKEKVLAAHRAGIRTIILPRENERDVEDVPVDVRRELVFIPVDTVEDVLREALGITLPGLMAHYTGSPAVPARNH
ncbi:MAG: endopeptidase La [Methanomicrobiales archaeon]|nr:endopeptidase La [Methanomicrobiales archaeon]